ncbi:MAG: hypothetical protein GF315_05015 [candidate division Zixibacteria bacterium]|nr:hypothetical protein [candidate division Zixibacteria bacterium]
MRTISYVVFIICMFVGFACTTAISQDYYNRSDEYNNYPAGRVERRILIDAITAGMLPRASFDFDVRTFSHGGVQAGVNVGILDQIDIGLSYGAGQLLSVEHPDWNPNMEFLLKFRLLKESYSNPAFAFGYNSQGSGAWDEVNSRYAIKSKGFFVVVTKSFLVYRNVMAFTAGMNLSMEDRDEDKDPSGYVGMYTQINDEVYLMAEYDLAINDNTRYDIYGYGRGFLNVGLEWALTPSVSIEFDFKDLLRNRDIPSFDREVRLLYIEHF